MILTVSLYFQNGDMEPQYHRYADFDWCMGGCPLIALTEYVAYLQLFGRIISCPLFALRRFGNSEALYRGSHSLYKLTLIHIKQARCVVQRRREYLCSLTYTQGPRQCCRRSRG